MKTLQQYLEENIKNGANDFALHALTIDGVTEFYIRPSDRDGETIDFIVQENGLTNK